MNCYSLREGGQVTLYLTRPPKPVPTIMFDLFVEAHQPLGPNSLVAAAYGALLQIFGNRIMLDNMLVGVVDFPVMKRIRLTIIVFKRLGLVITLIDGVEVFQKRIGRIFDLDQGTPTLLLGSPFFAGRVCNVQIWSHLEHRDFLKDLFTNKPYVTPGDILGHPNVNEVNLGLGAVEDPALYVT